MSKIFKAIEKTSGELTKAMFASLEEDGLVSPPSIAPASATGIAAARAEAVPDVPAKDLARASLTEVPALIRKLPVRLHGKSAMLPFGTTNCAAAEQYRMIRTRLLQHPRQPRSLLISSTEPGDGKSVTAVNIAAALSLKSDAKVLLADMDFRRSVLHTRLGMPVAPGLGEILSGKASLEESLIGIEQFPNLYFLSSGTPQANPSELLDSERWVWLGERLRSEFRYIVADAPPVASVADYELLQASCDGVVIVVRPDHTRREACLRALRMIPKEKIIGVVMNDVSDWLFTRRTHYNSYSSYYGRQSSNG